MLEEALRLVAEGQVGSLDELAAHLEISRDLAAQMLADLVRAGYLSLNQAGCVSPGRCEGCPQAAACALGSAVRLWTVTPKGLAWLARRGGPLGPAL
ncbi:MAG: hypothetical protein H5T59_10865 [Anaerolineae bacterium]|nr:hypothetical protein [Anaerolineae bacterium]